MIVFLGNAGPRYTGTRHNVGFAVGDILAKRCGVSINRLRSRALTARTSIGGHEVLLVKPQTFMNLSGEAVRPLSDYFKIPPERILVVSDEVALVPGRLRLRSSGSFCSGFHMALATPSMARLIPSAGQQGYHTIGSMVFSFHFLEDLIKIRSVSAAPA